MKTKFSHNAIFNGGNDNVSVIIRRKRYHVYYSESKNFYWIWYDSGLLEITIPEDVKHLVEKSTTK